MAEASPSQPAKDPYAEFPDAEGSPQAKDPYAEFPDAKPVSGEMIGAFGKQATGAAIQSGAEISGMVAGAGIGALGGPLAPVTVPLGAAVGFGAGYLAGEGAKDILGIPKINELPPDLRPAGVMGEVVGSGVPFAAAPIVAAKSGAQLPPSMVGNWINKIIQYAGEKPGLFFRSELAGLGSAGFAGAVAESYAPDDPLRRAAAEAVGGFFSPTRIITGATGMATDAVRNVMTRLSPAARETYAAQTLQNIIRDAGEDPEILAALLRQSGLPGLEVTAAQKTGSPALAALEAKLANESAKFGAEKGKMAEEGLQAIRDMIVALRGTGDPAALQAAAELRGQYFRTLLAARVQIAEREAVEAAQKISGDTPRARAQLSDRASRIVEDAMNDARTVERELWSRVPQDTPVNAGGILNKYETIRTEILPEEKLPEVVEAFVTRMRETQGATNSGELLRFRSRALALAREADAQGKANDARIYGQLAEAALDDLSAIGARGGGDVDVARQFSRELHETFTRTFAGESMQTTSRGADRIPPELLLRRALGSGREGADIRFQELEAATRFLETQGLGSRTSAANVGIMLDAQERILRLAAADAIDPNTGRASPLRLGKFLRDNEGLLDRFPEVRRDIQNAIASETGLRDIGRMAADASTVIERRAAFAKVAKVESPADAVRTAASSKTPDADLTALAKLAHRGGADAVDGVKASVWDYVIGRATSASGELSFDKLRAAFNDPLRPGLPSLGQIMQREGVMSSQDVERLNRLLSEARKIERAAEKGPELQKIMQNPDAMFDLVMRIAGSKLGGAAARLVGGGSTLIAQSAGSQYVRQVMGKVPQTRVMDVLIEASRKPEFMAALLEKPTSQAHGIRLARNIHAYLISAGLTQDSGQQPEAQ